MYILTCDFDPYKTGSIQILYLNVFHKAKITEYVRDTRSIHYHNQAVLQWAFAHTYFCIQFNTITLSYSLKFIKRALHQVWLP